LVVGDLGKLIDQLAELKTKGISIERTTTSDYVKTATVTDPAGNCVVFAELAASLSISPLSSAAGSATEVRAADERPPARRKGHCARPCGGQSRSTTLRRELLIFSAPL
jgi:hypothetical protein